jgi:phosphate transport system permease protein
LRLYAVAGSALAVAFLLALVTALLVQSAPLWQSEGVGGFLAGAEWHYRAGRFGALPMIYGTIVVSTLALLLALPIGLGAAVFTAEVLPRRARLLVKAVIELLAGVPSVVYGLLGALVLRDLFYRLLEPLEPLSGDSLLTAGVLLAVMVLPTLVSFADDALQAVPRSQRQAARALGLTRAQALAAVALPQALPGLVSAALLALGRALGETIAVFLVVGRQDNQLPAELSFLRTWIEPGQTLTSKLGGAETFLAYGEPGHWAAMMGLALVLLVLVLAVTAAGRALAARGSGAPGGGHAALR